MRHLSQSATVNSVYRRSLIDEYPLFEESPVWASYNRTTEIVTPVVVVVAHNIKAFAASYLAVLIDEDSEVINKREPSASRSYIALLVLSSSSPLLSFILVLLRGAIIAISQTLSFHHVPVFELAWVRTMMTVSTTG